MPLPRNVYQPCCLVPAMVHKGNCLQFMYVMLPCEQSWDAVGWRSHIGGSTNKLHSALQAVAQAVPCCATAGLDLCMRVAHSALNPPLRAYSPETPIARPCADIQQSTIALKARPQQARRCTVWPACRPSKRTSALASP